VSACASLVKEIAVLARISVRVGGLRTGGFSKGRDLRDRVVSERRPMSVRADQDR
jgi:hypothetical protein